MGVGGWFSTPWFLVPGTFSQVCSQGEGGLAPSQACSHGGGCGVPSPPSRQDQAFHSLRCEQCASCGPAEGLSYYNCVFVGDVIFEPAREATWWHHFCYCSCENVLVSNKICSFLQRSRHTKPLKDRKDEMISLRCCLANQRRKGPGCHGANQSLTKKLLSWHRPHSSFVILKCRIIMTGTPLSNHRSLYNLIHPESANRWFLVVAIAARIWLLSKNEQLLCTSRMFCCCQMASACYSKLCVAKVTTEVCRDISTQNVM